MYLQKQNRKKTEKKNMKYLINDRSLRIKIKYTEILQLY